MGQTTLGGSDLGPLREEYLTVVTERLPERAAAAGDWPIQDDHCFARVVLDNLFEDEWTTQISGRPAYRQLSETQLEAAVAIADRMLTGGEPVVRRLNRRSLRWRGELDPEGELPHRTE